MIPEAPLEQTNDGLVPAGEGWFVLNARDARWRDRPTRGVATAFEGMPQFQQVGVRLYVLEPGEAMGLYHWEANQEDFLVLSGEALLLVEGHERPLRQWDFVHCPPEANHIILGAGSGPCVVFAVGAREHVGAETWGGYPVDETAARHGVSVERKMSDKLDQLCIDIQTRIASVDAGRHLASGPLGEKPPNIYGAEGDWENFSTPSRDARLRAAFRGVYKLVDEALKNAPSGERAALAAKLAEAWRAHQSSPSCTIRYRNSGDTPVSLTLEDIQARIYDLSFDPYHCVEMRWGAHPSDREEMTSCVTATPAHFARFDEERRNRNVIDREDSPVTGPDYGPDVPADIDVRNLLHRVGAL